MLANILTWQTGATKLLNGKIPNRDTVIGFGNDKASVRLAELLLNAGLPQSQVVEYQLEDEGGFRGVGIHSAEATFYLPGSLGWDGLLAE